MSMNARIATPTAEGFLRAFLESYKDCRQSYTEPEWELVWSASEVWNCLVPWTTNLPELVRERCESVLAGRSRRSWDWIIGNESRSNSTVRSIPREKT